MSTTLITNTNPFTNPPTSGSGLPYGNSTAVPIDTDTAHKVLIGIGVLALVGVLMVEGAGHSKNAADMMIVLLIGVFLILGITNASKFANFASGQPYNPIP